MADKRCVFTTASFEKRLMTCVARAASGPETPTEDWHRRDSAARALGALRSVMRNTGETYDQVRARLNIPVDRWRTFQKHLSFPLEQSTAPRKGNIPARVCPHCGGAL